MFRSDSVRLSAYVLIFALGPIGCRNGAGPPVDAPSIDPGAAAAAALEAYDQDGDGSLSKAELAACQGLLPALADQEQLSEDAIAARLEALCSGGVGMMQHTCIVYLDRQPLAGATVEIEPEPFLGNAVRGARGVTDGAGVASMAIPDDQLPEEERGLHAVQPGIYKVRITHPNKKIPAKYNSATTLGIEIFPIGQDDSRFNLNMR